MPVYLDCFFDHKYEKLITEGPDELTPDEIQFIGDHWLKIQSQFYELQGSSGMESLLSQLWERDTLTARTQNIYTLLQKLAKAPEDETLRECLALRDYLFSPDLSLFEQEMRRAQAVLKGEIFKLKELLDLLDGMKNGTEAKRGDFTKQMVQVSRFMKSWIKLADLTAADYCELVRQLREHNEQHENILSDASS